MSFILSFLGKYWMQVGAILIIVSAVGYLYFTFNHLSKTVEAQKTTISQLDVSNKNLKETVEQVKTNQAMIDSIAKAISKNKNAQIIIKDKMNEVPVTTAESDRPFSDPGLLARASIMRDYQEQSYPSGPN